MPGPTFDEVIQRIITTRSEMYFDHGGKSHLMGRAPDGKTECGIQADLAKVYSTRRPKARVTCEECESLAPLSNQMRSADIANDLASAQKAWRQ